MPSRSWTTFAAGARQFVVQLALLMMWCFAGSYWSSFTPRTIVMSSCFAGALMITFFAPQVWKLFPRGETIHLSFWDYNDVAPAYFAAAEIAAREQKVGIITLEVARPDFPVAVSGGTPA